MEDDVQLAKTTGQTKQVQRQENAKRSSCQCFTAPLGCPTVEELKLSLAGGTGVSQKLHPLSRGAYCHEAVARGHQMALPTQDKTKIQKRKAQPRMCERGG